jgi:hypothetical protein
MLQIHDETRHRFVIGCVVNERRHDVALTGFGLDPHAAATAPHHSVATAPGDPFG